MTRSHLQILRFTTAMLIPAVVLLACGGPGGGTPGYFTYPPVANDASSATDIAGTSGDITPTPEPACGDGTCDGNEDCGNCALDCGACAPSCGDGLCDEGEDCLSCVDDCGFCASGCGDGECDADEDCGTCPTDCGACQGGCGDGICDSGETCANCESDCGPCSSSCGDGACNNGETCGTCPVDCGDCDPTSDTGNCCEVHDSPGCSVPEIESCVCQSDLFCCQQGWDSVCVSTVTEASCGTCP